MNFISGSRLCAKNFIFGETEIRKLQIWIFELRVIKSYLRIIKLVGSKYLNKKSDKIVVNGEFFCNRAQTKSECKL